MRLIDADELIEHVWRDRLDSRELIANLVESMPTIEPQPQDIARDIATIIENEKNMRVILDHQWIPVTERLPERNGRYLVTRGNDAGAFWNRVYIVNYSDLMGLNKEKHWWTGDVGKSNFERILDVLAWMPLPEPYKGKQE